MSSEVEICNLALSNIRAGSINSLSENSLQAQVCSLKYQILRDRCLREIPWSFNRKIKALATVAVDIFNWAYSYQYPVDCLKIHRLIGPYEEAPAGSSSTVARHRDVELLPVKGLRAQIPYEIFNVDDKKTIGVNQPELRIDYAAKVTDPNLFSDDFIMALSHLLASEVAIPIVGAEMGRALRSDSLELYNRYMASAISEDKNDQYLEPNESEFITVRR